MKYYIILAILLLTACESHEPKQQYLSTIIDLTEADSQKPSTDLILSYLDSHHPSDGLTLALRYVSDTRYTKRYQFELPMGETGLLSNEDGRRTKYRTLVKQFKDTLSQTQNAPSSRSEVFRLVADEVNRLSKIKGGGILLLSSDLKQHSDLFSVYHPKQRQLLLRHPKTVAKTFENNVAIAEDLSGIHIHILHTPSMKDDALFTAMVSIYKTIFESREAMVTVGVQNTVTLAQHEHSVIPHISKSS